MYKCKKYDKKSKKRYKFLPSYNINKYQNKYKNNYINSDDDNDDGLNDINVNCEDNHIYFYDDVNTKSILALNKYIKQLNITLLNTKMDMKNRFLCDVDLSIYLHINSNGGSVFDSLAGVDTIINSQIPIISIIEGCAASAATFLSIVCKKRQITDHSSMLIHQLSSGGWGTYEQIKDEYNNCTYLQDTIIKLYLEYSGEKLTSEKLKKCLKRDIWWNSKKCKKYGLIDEII